MRLYRKDGNNIQILASPDEEVRKGEYLIVEEPEKNRAFIIQVIDIQFANVPGTLEDLLRESATDKDLSGNDVDPFDVKSHIAVLKDTRLLVCKVRGGLTDGSVTRSTWWLPSRVKSEIRPLCVITLAKSSPKRPIRLGSLDVPDDFAVDASTFDGSLNVITGRKGTGKSHLTKALVLGLLDYDAPCMIFDVNGEYVKLGTTPSGRPSPYSDKIVVLTPRRNLRFMLSQIGQRAFVNLMSHGLDLPPNSVRVLLRIWNELESRGRLTMNGLGEAISAWDCHESIRDALMARYNTLLDAGITTDDPERGLKEDELAATLSHGKAVIVDLRNQSAVIRRIVVELILSKVSDLLSTHKLQALFLFAEEAHLYLRETYWDDIVTRMRHLGIFTTFVTNQPDTLQEGIYRQADNIFIFNFANERDLDFVSRAAKVDSETVQQIVRELPDRHCLVVGDMLHQFPVIMTVKPLGVRTMGETRLFFDKNRERLEPSRAISDCERPAIPSQ